ncbi:NADH-quinone oxidoreductase chain 3 [Rhodovastum atsumiense]|uniref:NADH-quinone oxidoreductase n=1 Tax=Rhodovastum atsumiense TaxID=504468 RepID=A0A5M6J1A6_9PROT|nr:NADH-quinone oxidoreductase subunit NuoG [Rhodovastum atsumiense]KAA5614373.1 NADH-quinone oxidoreductase subunit G [Rhodovastum atsumiense]CAH2604847.1 NADH-quinone oxidoreductase chain 3 [Rhodovastum atsumiense]
MVKVTVDGIEVEVAPGSNVLQACEAAGREVPRFCYHERLSVAGNCRMCLVEIEKAPPKPFASCSYPVADGMVVHTDTPMVRAARRGVMEFLLINHPLDCPICDQGGECDLQDQAVGYGMDHSRYAENKRAVKDKNLGPLVKTTMTRCIHCTRCIRFSAEIAGVPELGATARGESMEVTTYVERALSSELSGNLIDICPVGALTSKPYAFVARPWELRKTDSVDVFDAVGASIRVDSRGPEVLRVLPRINEDVNEEWLADKSRFAIDGLKRRRLDSCWVKRDGKLQRASWPDAFEAIAKKLDGVDGELVGAVAGNLADAESMLALRDLMTALGSANLDCRQDGAAADVSRRDFYTFNTSIAGIEEADALLIIGSNPRREAPLLNARIRKRWLQGNFPVAVIGPQAELTYEAEWIGSCAETISALIAGKHSFAATLRAAKKPMLILGQGALARPDGQSVLAAAWKLAAGSNMLTAEWHGFNVLHTAASRVGALDLHFLPGGNGKSLPQMLHGGVDVLWLLGADEFDTEAIGPDTFVIYQGSHGDRGAARADVILPGAAYTEKHGTYVNTEGRVQRGFLAVYPPGEAREDWRIIRAFSQYIDRTLPYDDIDAVRARLEQINPVFGRLDILPRFGCTDHTPPAGNPAALKTAPFVPWIPNYYQTDPISRASPTMAECARVHVPVPAQAAE